MSMAYRLILHVKEMAGSEGDISIIVRRMQGSFFNYYNSTFHKMDNYTFFYNIKLSE